jgi:hypothetical protein
MQKHSLPVIFLLELMAPAAADDEPLIILGMKNFTDTGDMVHVEGTLTRDGIGYKNNRSAVTCYRDTRECIVTHIEAGGRQVFSIGLPDIFTVRVWKPDRIVADFAVSCGEKPKSSFRDNPLSKEEWQSTASDTWIIDRARQTAELTDHPCLGAKITTGQSKTPSFGRKLRASNDVALITHESKIRPPRRCGVGVGYRSRQRRT